MKAAYEVRNPSLSDMTLETQIEKGVNDWCAEDDAGREFFGLSRDEAEANRTLYHEHKARPVKILKPGQRGTTSGFRAVVIRHYVGNMYEFRVPGGGVCIDACDFIPDEQTSAAPSVAS